MIRVSQLYIQNVGPFKGQKFDFSVEDGHPDIHIFVGPNGSGKTTILHGLAGNFNALPVFTEIGEDHKKYISNSFHKRYHLFEDEIDETTPKSFIFSSIEDRNSKNIIHETLLFGCSTCDGLHRRNKLIAINNENVSEIRQLYSDSVHLNEAINNYLIDTTDDYTKRRKFKFAVFGYSGYRFINSAQIETNQHRNFNPFDLALEFNKKNDENSNISNWIVSRYSKAAIEETHGNKEVASKYREGLNCLIDSIAELTDNKFSFKIKTNPFQVVTKYYDKEVEFDVLPDGLRSILSWMGDLLMRLDKISWENKEIPVNEQDIILLLDEIEVHLHPKWQYKILPLTKKIFPNAQIFISTHSPFILNSIDNAKIYKLKVENGESVLDDVILSNTGDSYSYVYENILETFHKFGPDTTKDLKRFNEIDKELINSDFTHEEEFKGIVSKLRTEGEEVTAIISSKLFRLKDVTGKDYLNGKN